MKKSIVSISIILLISAAGFSQTLIKHCLDSIVPTNGGKDIFSYDSKGNCIEEICNVWGKHIKVEFTYDNEDRQIIQIHYRWDDERNNWSKKEKSEMVYDSNGNKTTFNYRWEDDSNWEETEKYKSEYTYDKNRNLTMYIIYQWDDDWKEYEKHEYTYDNRGNQILEIFYKTYDWDEDEKYESIYDNKGNKTMDIHYYWRNNDWGKSSKFEYTYDDNGNRIMFIYYHWEDEINDWEKLYKCEAECDLSYSRKKLIVPSTYEYVYKNMITKETYNNWSITDWRLDGITTYYWSAKKITTDNKK